MMDDNIGKGDLHVNVTRQQSVRQGGSNKSSMSGRSTPRDSPSFRRWNSSRTPRRDGRNTGGILQWFRSNSLVYWLLLITLWAYFGFHFQSRWAHDNKDEFSGFGGKPRHEISDSEQSPRRELTADQSSLAGANETTKIHVGDSKKPDVLLATKGSDVSSQKKVTLKKKNKRVGRKLRDNGHVKKKSTVKVEKNGELMEGEIPMTNTSYGLLVGPFGSIEDRVLKWSPEKRSGTCDRKGDFARLVWSRKFVLVFHELSMTGAPISMMELATEMLSCGASVSAVVLSKKGGLLPELSRRKIRVLEDKADLSFKTAMKADLVIAGSAVCVSWIDKYMDHFPAGGSQIAWWIMENRREYFDQAKVVLDRVKMLVFLSELQTKLWLTWCEEEKIKLRSQPVIVPLSVNDELTYVAGLPCSLNTPTFSPLKMVEKRLQLRTSVRSKMGLSDNDMLVMSLSSINPGKGQLLLLESAGLLLEPESFQIKSKIKSAVNIGKDKTSLAGRLHLRGLKSDFKDIGVSDGEGTPKQNLKVLIGSAGSKSNKVEYVKEMLGFLSQHTNLSKSVLWTPATTRVSSLYSAADVYVTNSQGIGETFGRVTIEAMAYGLPVLGTDAGGTKEIVDHNVTGLLHPLGRPGTHALSQNLRFLLENPSERQKMGTEGRKKVEEMYLKQHMYKKFVQVMYRCMKP